MFLRNLTVLSLEQATTLPFLTYRLACEGARVIRVEHPKQPDPNRFVGRSLPGEGGMGAAFLANNCGKQAITLDLGQPEGRDLLQRLITALPVDIFACNQRPRSYAKLGIDYPTLASLKPDLIWIGISGFGPEHDEAAYDPVLQARSGLMDLTGQPDGSPTPFGLPMVDLGAGEHGYGQVMRALYRRAVTGEGSRIDLSMLRSAVSWLSTPLMLAASFGERPRRTGTRHPQFAPVSVYRTADGYIYLAIGSDRQWAQLVTLPLFAVLGRPAYERNAGRIAAVDALGAEIEACLRPLRTAEALDLLRSAGIPVSPVQAVHEVIADPLVAPELVRVTDSRSGAIVVLPGPPAGPPVPLSFPPRLGEHNTAVYGQALGLGPADLAGLRERSII